MKTARKKQIVWCYVVVTRGQLPTDLGELLRAMREIIGDVNEAEVLASIKWALRLRSPREPRQPSQAPAQIRQPS